MMKKRIAGFALVICVLLSGCSKAQTIETLDVSDPDNFADCLVEILKDKDDSRLYNFFSDETKEYDSNLQSEVKQYVDYFDGDYVSYSLQYSESSEHTRADENDKYKEQVFANYIITTTKASYFISFSYTNEAPNKKYIGLQSLGVQLEEEFHKEPCIKGDIHGCYVVTSDNHAEIEARNEYDKEKSSWY